MEADSLYRNYGVGGLRDEAHPIAVPLQDLGHEDSVTQRDGAVERETRAVKRQRFAFARAKSRRQHRDDLRLGGVDAASLEFAADRLD